MLNSDNKCHYNTYIKNIIICERPVLLSDSSHNINLYILKLVITNPSKINDRWIIDAFSWPIIWLSSLERLVIPKLSLLLWQTYVAV